VRAWDRLSLALCHGQRAPQSIPAVPTAGGEATLTLTPLAGDAQRLSLAPWPFRDSSLTLVVEGRRLPATFADEAALRAALRQAPWETLSIELRPG
jgi:hypothetical protein